MGDERPQFKKVEYPRRLDEDYMTFVVPFDGTPLSREALLRATEFAPVKDATVVAVSIIPHDNKKYAKEQGWLDDESAYEVESVVRRLKSQVKEIAPDAEYHHRVVDRWANSGTIAARLKRFIRDEDTSMVFLGSENAGNIITSVSNIGPRLTTKNQVDIVLVRRLSDSNQR